LEDSLRCADEHALERLRKATTLERVATGAGAFCHWRFSRSMRAPPSKAARGKTLIIAGRRRSPEPSALSHPGAGEDVARASRRAAEILLRRGQRRGQRCRRIPAPT